MQRNSDCVYWPRPVDTSQGLTFIVNLKEYLKRIKEERQVDSDQRWRRLEDENGFKCWVRVTRQHTEEGGETSDDSNDEIGGRGDGGASDDFQVAMLAHIAQRTDALVAALVLIINASRAVTATRPPCAFIHVAATTSVFSLTRWTTKEKKRCHTHTHTQIINKRKNIDKTNNAFCRLFFVLNFAGSSAKGKINRRKKKNVFLATIECVGKRKLAKTINTTHTQTRKRKLTLMTLVNPNCRSENNNKKTEHTTDFFCFFF